jgi:hypothetical protein
VGKWRDSGYWRWLWRDRLSGGAKVFLATLAALLIATGGYASARGFAPEEDDEVLIERVVTLVHKEQVPGSEKVVTVRRTITTREPQKPKVVTVQRNGRTLTVSAPVQTIAGTTVTTKGKERIVKLPGRTVTVAGETRTRRVVERRTDTVINERTNTITTPSRTETIEREGPSRTVTNERTVTSERTVTGPSTTTTVTNEVTVTAPPKTVTETQTVTTPPVTVTVTIPTLP